jgi:DNA polymerase-3 subunit epsilon
MALRKQSTRLFAVVDIETTGGHAAAHAITELAVLVHNGEQVVQRYHTLINPGCAIPRFITGLTGITDEMVADAPYFDDIAEEVYTLLHDKVFVAHNVNFDYSFLRHHLMQSGYTLNVSKLCTVRLSRKVFPGLKSYSLGNVCAYRNISINDRHRAMGDAEATVKLFTQILQHDSVGALDTALKKGSKESLLPPNLLKQDMEKLPSSAGVYYFHNAAGKVVYVGKAKNIKRRVTSHFSNNSAQKQKQDFMRHVQRISFVETGNELFAQIQELIEIKEKWPEFNRAMKGYTPRYGLFMYPDQKGYMRLAVKTIARYQQPLYYFRSVIDGVDFLKEQAAERGLCLRLCGIETGSEGCRNYHEGTCDGACLQTEDVTAYNLKVAAMLEGLKEVNYILTASGRHENEVGVLLVEQGNFWGYGFVEKQEFVHDREWLLQRIPRAKWFPGIDQLIYSAS